MRVLVAYNPTAGDNGGDDVRKLVALLEAEGHEVKTQSVKEEHWKRALGEPFELVVAAGGDGTVGKVFKRLAGSDAPVAIVPIGSANNIARSLEPACSERTRFDIGSLASKGETVAFVESCGGGVFAEMVARANDYEGDDKVELGLRSLRDVAGDVPAERWRVEADGTDLSGEFIAVEVLNIALLGPNVPLAPRADPGDGLLDLALVRAGDAAALAAYARARLEGRPAPELRLETHRARRIVVGPPARVSVRLDDELLDGTSGEIVATLESSVEICRPPFLDRVATV